MNLIEGTCKTLCTINDDDMQTVPILLIFSLMPFGSETVTSVTKDTGLKNYISEQTCLVEQEPLGSRSGSVERYDDQTRE